MNIFATVSPTSELQVRSVASGQLIRSVATSVGFVAVSPDGHTLYYQGDGNAPVSSLALSADGSHIAFVSQRNAFVLSEPVPTGFASAAAYCERSTSTAQCRGVRESRRREAGCGQRDDRRSPDRRLPIRRR